MSRRRRRPGGSILSNPGTPGGGPAEDPNALRDTAGEVIDDTTGENIVLLVAEA